MPFLIAVFAIIGLVLAVLTSKYWKIRAVFVLPYQKGVLTRKGSFVSVLEPGRYRLTPSSAITQVDMRLQVLTVNGQEVLSEDGISVKISVAGEYCVTDPKQYLYATAQPVSSLYLYAQTAVRETMAGQSFDNLLKVRAELDGKLLAIVGPQAQAIGLQLQRLQIRDVMLSGEMKRALGAQIAARQEGLAALERARGETAALRNLANAARLMEESPALVQLRALQTVEGSKGNTLVLGVGQGPVVVKRPEEK